MSEVTELIDLSRGGDRAVADPAFRALYDERMRLGRGQPHAAGVPRHAAHLVHQASCGLVRADEPGATASTSTRWPRA